MPYVNIKITDDGVTPEEKRALIVKTTAALQEVLGKEPEHTMVVIETLPRENWGRMAKQYGPNGFT
ncbi:tautomerase family protein [Acanthopleuribacter pedis]|uniref:4-oxalocrotonate tautomerase family protein n=1 Tax=Acanthopleuribacter pedis TaxID=442870 RepID=A0A8J7QAV3_9BACT|nr:4-oxalocrotonate tautomerase family protein [Acanthopleuribacter pedis]MBO1317426.1 4-oxalocrotonate tautomerase family protein [Acanthopleuribacter pedis]